MIDGYTKSVLTVIAVSLVWLAVENSITSADAARSKPQPVFLASISTDAAKCIAGYTAIFNGDTGSCIWAY